MGEQPPVDGRCDGCGFDYEADLDAQTAQSIRVVGDRFGLLFEAMSDDRLRSKPAPNVWSALEYACHVRDVLAVQRERLDRALAEHHPVLESRGMFRWADEHHYGEQHASVVLRQLKTNAEALATAVEALGPDDWDRLLVYGYPQPTDRTIRWFLRHTIHEGEHHMADAMRS